MKLHLKTTNFTSHATVHRQVRKIIPSKVQFYLQVPSRHESMGD